MTIPVLFVVEGSEDKRFFTWLYKQKTGDNLHENDNFVVLSSVSYLKNFDKIPDITTRCQRGMVIYYCVDNDKDGLLGDFERHRSELSRFGVDKDSVRFPDNHYLEKGESLEELLIECLRKKEPFVSCWRSFKECLVGMESNTRSALRKYFIRFYEGYRGKKGERFHPDSWQLPPSDEDCRVNKLIKFIGLSSSA